MLAERKQLMTVQAWIANRLRRFRWMFTFRRLLLDWQPAWQALLAHQRGVTLRLRDGLVLQGGDRDDVAGIFNEIFVERCYTPSWFYRPEPGHTVLDVGANIGVFPLFLHSMAPGIRVLAFEPHPVTFQQLMENLRANRLEEKVQAYQLAVSQGPGVVRFSGASGIESGHEAATAEGHGEAVASIGLAEAVARAGQPIDLLKVDTEGAEAEIITAAPATTWSRIARAVVEYHDLQKRDQVVHALEQQGYHCRVVPARGYEHHLGLIYARRA
jgi:FkbM family methyltransferase